MATLRFTAEMKLAVPADALWDVLGDFGTEHRWASALASCTRDMPDVRIGTARTCTLRKPVMGRTRVREVVIEYDRGNAIGYELDGEAGPFRTAGSRWSVRATSPQTTLLAVAGRFTPKWYAWLVWPVAKLAIRRLARRGMRELEAFVRERDTLSPRARDDAAP